jgi:hypothetical protein
VDLFYTHVTFYGFTRSYNFKHRLTEAGMMMDKQIFQHNFFLCLFTELSRKMYFEAKDPKARVDVDIYHMLNAKSTACRDALDGLLRGHLPGLIEIFNLKWSQHTHTDCGASPEACKLAHVARPRTQLNNTTSVSVRSRPDAAPHAERR